MLPRRMCRLWWATIGGQEVSPQFICYMKSLILPRAMVRDIVQHSAEERKQIILGIDANAHHILCGSTDINPWGELLMEYMGSTKLNILNKGTFFNVRRKKVIDLTLGTTLVGNLVSDWHVSSEEPLSDQRYICFKIKSLWFTGTPRRPIGLYIDKTIQLSLEAFQGTYTFKIGHGVGRWRNAAVHSPVLL